MSLMKVGFANEPKGRSGKLQESFLNKSLAAFTLPTKASYHFFPQWQKKQRGLEWRLHAGILGGSAQALGNCSCLQRCLEPVPKCLFPHVGFREKKPHAKEFSVLQTVRQVIFFSPPQRGMELRKGKLKKRRRETVLLASLTAAHSKYIYIFVIFAPAATLP